MQERTSSTDVVVIGGGLAGVSAAVAAARLGSSVALITNRPVLGGNSSSEVRVWVVGATAHGTQRFSRETGIMGELFLENQYRNAEGNPHYWDQVVLDLVRAEPNLTLHLNTDVRTVRMHEDRHAIRSVTGWTMGSELQTTFEAPVFLDCTGDGLIGHLAGAEYRIGREARSEYGEEWAPEEADDELLGSSLFFYTKDAGRPSRFVPPSIAKDIGSTPILANRIIRTGDNGCDYWWIEWGGELDTVTENERIRDELWGVVFGIWDHIKNSGDFDSENLTLEWVGSLPGKREYRRFVGDHTLTQNDILDQVEFPDAVAFGGWSIDLHPVEGVYADRAGAQQRYSAGTYGIPYRSLYSRNVENLLFAGRDISASHVAFGSTRVMATCSTQGQAAGTAASLIARRGITPRALGRDHLDLLLTTLAREDAPVVGLRAADPDDLAPRATVTATSTLTAIGTGAAGTGERYPLDRDVAVVLPVDPRLDTVAFAVDAPPGTELTVELWTTGRPQNYAPIEHVQTTTAVVAAGDTGEGVATAAFAWTPPAPCNGVVVVRAHEGASLLLTDDRPYGVLALERRLAADAAFDHHIAEEEDQPVTDWVARKLRRRSFAFEALPATAAYRPEHVVDGYQRPYGGPHLWSSATIADGRDLREAPESISLTWEQPVTIGSVRIVFNDDVDEDLVNLHHHRTDFEVVPELVTDYRVEVRVDGHWVTAAEVSGNRHRHRIHDLEPVAADALRVTACATGGARVVTVSAIKAYSEPSGRTHPWT
ncbi:FAD-dependent oxidoreductase [uncultured Leifsonia sp.]|uniref:FAD-dependent oxidoreductase n=1 Tax=uncultured Leifsonia sp. TaxID=340359 RepID=UPI0028D21F33|nr:FAD-dependent oxidoreductase [uncultured Leifsonia sp.]